MNLLDATIVYFACSAPFGTYYFIKNRHNKHALWLKTILVTIFWIPFSAKLLHENFWNKAGRRNLNDSSPSNLQNAQQLAALRSEFEQFIPKGQSKTSLFEIREIIERYAGLTIAIQNTDNLRPDHQNEIFRISQSNNIKLSSLCFNRRNRQKLSAHQTQARTDFLEIVKTLSTFDKKSEAIKEYAFRFVSFLKDKEAIRVLEAASFNSPQKEKAAAVGFSAEDLWTPQKLQ